MDTKLPRPPYDPELEGLLAKLAIPEITTLEMVHALRENLPVTITIEQALSRYPVTHSEHQIPGPTNSDPQITISVFSPKETSTQHRPCLYFIHGGGMVMGTRFTLLEFALDVLEECDAICASVEYRLAPEHPYPAGLEDCFAGLKWVVEKAEELGVDPARIIIAGHSGGACLAAGTALLCRDRKGPRLHGQFLGCPMLDDRNETVSARQFVDGGTWTREGNIMAWNAYLKGRAGKEGVSIYAAAAQAEDLSGLPTTYIDAGSAEVFRDEAVAYASKLWACGVQAELHIWAGGWHGFEALIPTASLSVSAKKAQMDWIKKVFGVGSNSVPQPVSV